MTDLAAGGNAHEFQVHHISAGVSFIVVDAPPGGGPRLNGHPYGKASLVQQSAATFTAGEEVIEASAGQVVVVPAGMPHRFVNSGTGPLRQVDIHPSGRIRQDNIPGDS